LIELARQALDEKQGEEIVVMDLRKFSSIANFFIVCSGNSDRHVRALADHVIEKLRQEKVKAYHVEGLEEGRWVLVDFSDVVVHVFYRETRQFYNLERLWGNAPRI